MDSDGLVIQQLKSLCILRVVIPHSLVRCIHIFLNLVHLVNHRLEHHPLGLVAGGFAHILCNDNRLVGTNDLYLACTTLYGIHCSCIYMQLCIVIESMQSTRPLKNHTHCTIATGHFNNIVRLLHPHELTACRLRIEVIGILSHAAGVQCRTYPCLAVRGIFFTLDIANAVLNEKDGIVLPVAITGNLVLGSVDVALLAHHIIVIIIGYCGL